MKPETITLADPSDCWNFQPGDVLKSSDGRTLAVTSVDHGAAEVSFRSLSLWGRVTAWARGLWRRMLNGLRSR